jgi:hypothetical protein
LKKFLLFQKKDVPLRSTCSPRFPLEQRAQGEPFIFLTDDESTLFQIVPLLSGSSFAVEIAGIEVYR